MNWEAIGAIGEVLGAIAVFVTLLYLAIQVRHARSEARRALSQARTEANRDLIRLGLEERNLQASMKAEAAFSSQTNSIASMLMSKGLTPEEAARVAMIFTANWNYVVQIVPTIDDLSPPEREMFDGYLRNRFGRPGASQALYQQLIKPNALAMEVIDYVDSVLESGVPSLSR